VRVKPPCGHGVGGINKKRRTLVIRVSGNDLQTIPFDESNPIPDRRNRPNAFRERFRIPARMKAAPVLT
jgi:hypothetical protein